MDDLLREVLESYPESIRPRSGTTPLGNAGGLSGARLWRFDATAGPVVARAWPPEMDAARLARIHGWMGEAVHLGFVPAPIADRRGRTYRSAGGRLWEVAPWMPGRAVADRPPSTAEVGAGFLALGAFHRALARHRMEGPSPGLRARLAELAALRREGFDALDRVLDRAGADPFAVRARRWLDLARARAGSVAEGLRAEAERVVPLQPCLRDARPDHLLFVGDRVAGLVDFGAMGIETIAADLSRLMAEWIGPDRGLRAEALAAYATSRPLEGVEVDQIAAFERTGAVLGGARWVRWHFVEGRRFDDPAAVVKGLRRALDRMSDPDPTV